MLDKAALIVGGLGLGFAGMYFLMHKPGAPFEESGLIHIGTEDTTSPWTYVAIGAGAVAVGAVASHVYHKQAM